VRFYKVIVLTNQVQLELEIEKKFAKALETIADDVLKIFKADYIDKFAYIKNPKMYERTGEFREAWLFSPLKKQLMTLSKELYYDPSKLKTFKPETYIHGSLFSNPNDIRETLPSILEGKQSSAFLSVSRTIKFWDWFVGAMIHGGQLEKIITKHMSSAGFRKI